MQLARESHAKAMNDNKQIYYDQVPPVDSLPQPDPQNFVNLEAITDELNKPCELDGKMRHLVPPEFRAM